MSYCGWRKFLGIFLILASSGCSQFYNLPEKKSSNPVNLNTVETRRINKKKPDRQAEAFERRDLHADSEKEFQEAENILITFLEASDKDKQWMIPELKKSMSYIDSHANECPGYLPFVNTCIKIKLGLLSEAAYQDKLDLGIFSYIAQIKDLASLIRDMQRFRGGKAPENLPVSHISSGLFSRRYFLKEKDIVNSVIPLNRLRGKAVVKIGGESGGLAAELAAQVIDKSAGSGRLVVAEAEPSLLDFARFMGRYDKSFSYAELRRCGLTDGICDPNLKAGEADLVCLFDAHYFYDKFNEAISEQEKFKRGSEYLVKIKNGMKKNGLLLICDSESFTCPAERVRQMAEAAGLRAEIKSENLDNAVNPRDIKFLVICRKN